MARIRIVVLKVVIELKLSGVGVQYNKSAGQQKLNWLVNNFLTGSPPLLSPNFSKRHLQSAECLLGKVRDTCRVSLTNFTTKAELVGEKLSDSFALS